MSRSLAFALTLALLSTPTALLAQKSGQSMQVQYGVVVSSQYVEEASKAPAGALVGGVGPDLRVALQVEAGDVDAHLVDLLTQLRLLQLELGGDGLVARGRGLLIGGEQVLVGPGLHQHDRDQAGDGRGDPVGVSWRRTRRRSSVPASISTVSRSILTRAR